MQNTQNTNEKTSKHPVSNKPLTALCEYQPNIIFSGDESGNLFSFDLTSGQIDFFENKHGSKIIFVTVLNSSKQMLSVSESGLIYLHDVQTKKLLNNCNLTNTYNNPGNFKITAVTLLDDLFAVIGTNDNIVQIVNIQTQQISHSIRCDTECRFLTAMDSGSFIAGYFGGYITQYTLEAGGWKENTLKMPYHRHAVAAPISVFSNKEVLVAESDNGSYLTYGLAIIPGAVKYVVYNVNLKTNKVEEKIQIGAASIKYMLLANGKRYLFAASEDNTLKIINIQNKNCTVMSLKVHSILQLNDHTVIYGDDQGNLCTYWSNAVAQSATIAARSMQASDADYSNNNNLVLT